MNCVDTDIDALDLPWMFDVVLFAMVNYQYSSSSTVPPPTICMRRNLRIVGDGNYRLQLEEERLQQRRELLKLSTIISVDWMNPATRIWFVVFFYSHFFYV